MSNLELRMSINDPTVIVRYENALVCVYKEERKEALIYFPGMTLTFTDVTRESYDLFEPLMKCEYERFKEEIKDFKKEEAQTATNVQ